MRLRIVVWNCTMRLHDKVGRLRGLRPDLAVVPECACPEVLLRRTDEVGAHDFAWEGSNPRKGLTVLAFGPWRLDVDRRHRLSSGTTLPVRVTGPAKCGLLAVWALPPWGHRRGAPPPEPLSGALDRLADFVAERPMIVAGDFHQILTTRVADGAPRASRLSRRLEQLGLVSAYHADRGVACGAETEPTFFRYRRPSGRHHVDHVFVDEVTARGVRRVEVGVAARWLSSSDHAPVVVELEIGSGG